MCTIIALHRVCPDFPVVLATNRDEFYARPATGPVRLLSQPAAVGGRDEEAGGTWMGVTAGGFFVGVTNQRSFAARREGARSRGALVLDVLRLAAPEPARQHVAGLDPRRYNDFNLLFGDSAGMWLAYGRAAASAVRVEPLPAGLHVLPNDELDSPDFPKCARAKALLGSQLAVMGAAEAADDAWPRLREALARTLADGVTTPQPAPENAPAYFDDDMMRSLTALCVRTPVYGTRSATMVALAPGRCAHYLYADGPPDRTPFADVTPLFGGPEAVAPVLPPES